MRGRKRLAQEISSYLAISPNTLPRGPFDVSSWAKLSRPLITWANLARPKGSKRGCGRESLAQQIICAAKRDVTKGWSRKIGPGDQFADRATRPRGRLRRRPIFAHGS